MDNDSTRNDGPLSLAERARLGLLLLEPALRLDDIAELECPERRYGPKAEAWIKRLEAACKWGDLQLEPGEIYDPFGGWPYISRENYRTWRATQHNLPADSQITKWLGATPAVEALPPVEPSLPELPVLAVLPETVATGVAAEKRAALLCLLDEVDKRAAEQGAGFNRRSLPGTKEEFQTLAIAFNRRAFSKALSTFSDYLTGHCQFQPGAKPDHGKGAAIWALFPEYPLKLG